MVLIVWNTYNIQQSKYYLNFKQTNILQMQGLWDLYEMTNSKVARKH